MTTAGVLFSPDNAPCHFTAAFAAGFCTTIVASPVDVVKTRYMNSVSGQYSGAINCALTMLVKEGPTAFYKGYVVKQVRITDKAKTEWEFFLIDLILFSYLFFLASCRRLFVWVPGTLWCLWATSRLKELWLNSSCDQAHSWFGAGLMLQDCVYQAAHASQTVLWWLLLLVQTCSSSGIELQSLDWMFSNVLFLLQKTFWHDRAGTAQV